MYLCTQGILDQINDSLTKEYSNRRTMLIMRAQLTAQSFGWSDKSKVSILSVTPTVILVVY